MQNLLEDGSNLNLLNLNTCVHHVFSATMLRIFFANFATCNAAITEKEIEMQAGNLDVATKWECFRIVRAMPKRNFKYLNLML